MKEIFKKRLDNIYKEEESGILNIFVPFLEFEDYLGKDNYLRIYVPKSIGIGEMIKEEMEIYETKYGWDVPKIIKRLDTAVKTNQIYKIDSQFTIKEIEEDEDGEEIALDLDQIKIDVENTIAKYKDEYNIKNFEINIFDEVALQRGNVDDYYDELDQKKEEEEYHNAYTVAPELKFAESVMAKNMIARYYDRIKNKELEYDGFHPENVTSESLQYLEAYMYDEKRNDVADDIDKVLEEAGKSKLAWDINKAIETSENDAKDLQNQKLDSIVEYFKKKALKDLKKAVNTFFVVLNNTYYNKKSIPLKELDKYTNEVFDDALKNFSTFAKGSGAMLFIKKLVYEYLEKNDIEIKESLKNVLEQRHMDSTIGKIKDEEEAGVAKATYGISKAVFFAGTLNKRLAAISNKGFETYFNNMFQSNGKISATGNSFTQDELQEILNSINDIRKNKKQKPISFPDKTIKVKMVNFTIPAFESKIGVTTCTSARACAYYCYAKAGKYEYPAAMAKSEISLLYTLSKDFAKDAIKHISEKFDITPHSTTLGNKLLIVRIHDAGDFYSLKYLAKWLKIIKTFPTVLFYAYTKQLKLSQQELPANFVVTHSIGGQRDSELNEIIMSNVKIKHSRIFSSQDELKEAEYHDNSEIDKHAAKPLRKGDRPNEDNTGVGLVIHHNDESVVKNYVKQLEAKKKKGSITLEEYLDGMV